MDVQETRQEHAALSANDIRALVSQLNEAVKCGAENHGLRVEMEVSNVIDIKGRATCYPIASVRIFTEVR